MSTPAVITDLGSLGLFVGEVLRTGLRTRGNLRPILGQIAQVSYRSLPTVAFAGVFIGAILVIQFNAILSRYDAQVFLGGLNSSAVIREVGPLIISFLLAGKVGAYTAAELGSMRVTEQIDAIRCLGTNPVQFLILPRFVAIVVSSVILLTLSLIIGVGGSMVVAQLLCGINPWQYISTIPRFITPWVFTSALIKCGAYGMVVASVSCHQGYTARNGARGVGQAVTRAAIYTNLYIIFVQFVASPILNRIGEALR